MPTSRELILLLVWLFLAGVTLLLCLTEGNVVGCLVAWAGGIMTKDLQVKYLPKKEVRK